MARIQEETHVEYTNDEDLSYEEIQSEDVNLYVKDKFVGHIKVWLDDLDCEYVCINYNITYLHDLDKR